MKNLTFLHQSIHRFQSAFWGKNLQDRPPIGVADTGQFLPMGYLKGRLSCEAFNPADVNEELAITDYQFMSSRPHVACDDFIPFATPWRAIPWLEAMCGCRVLCSEGSCRPEHFVSDADRLLELPIGAPNGWLERMLDLTARHQAAAPQDCWISPSILRGPSDVVAAMRGMVEFYMDLVDAPEAIADTAKRVNNLLIDVLTRHFGIVGPKLGGYGHIYGYWAPRPTVVIQEDTMGMCSPQTYRDVFMPLNAAVVEALGDCVFFHLHSTGYGHWRDVLEIPNLAGIELTVESNGPAMLDLVPMMRETLERSRLMLFVDHYFHQLPEVLRQIPHEGLYLLIANRDIPDEQAFNQFVEANW